MPRIKISSHWSFSLLRMYFSSLSLLISFGLKSIFLFIKMAMLIFFLGPFGWTEVISIFDGDVDFLDKGKR